MPIARRKGIRRAGDAPAAGVTGAGATRRPFGVGLGAYPRVGSGRSPRGAFLRRPAVAPHIAAFNFVRNERATAVPPPGARVRVKQYLHVFHSEMAPESVVLQNRLDSQAAGATMVDVLELECAALAPRTACVRSVVG